MAAESVEVAIAPQPDVIEELPVPKQCRPHRWIWNNRRILTCALIPLILIPVPLAHPSPVSPYISQRSIVISLKSELAS